MGGYTHPTNLELSVFVYVCIYMWVHIHIFYTHSSIAN